MLRRWILITFTFVFSILPCVTVHAFSDGMNAVDMIGKYEDPTATPLVPLYSSFYLSKIGLYSPRAIALDVVAHRLFVADTEAYRVVVYDLNTDNTFHHYYADHVLGQPDMIANYAVTTQNGMKQPYGLAYDAVGSRLFVTDSNNNRILVFDVTSIDNGENAVNVLGQPDFTSGSLASTQNGLQAPQGLQYDATSSRLFIADSGNKRVVIYSVGSITNGMNASNVLGQPNFTSSASAATQNGMNTPYGIVYDSAGSRLFVADTQNCRVTSYSLGTLTDGMNATNVLGQPNFVRNTQGGTYQNGMTRPYRLAYDSVGSRLFVVDANINHVTVFNVSSITNGQNASNVLGQPNYASGGTATTQNGMNSPYDVAYDATNCRLYVSDFGNNRILTFSASSISDGMNAFDVLGQVTDHANPITPIFTKGGTLDSPHSLGIGNYSVNDIVLDPVRHHLFLVDNNNSRIQVFDLDANNAFLDKIPDHVLGQSSFLTRATATSQAGFSGVFGLAYDPARNYLFASEYSNNRVLVFNVSTVTNGMNAINVLGQPNFASSTSATTQNGMKSPYGLAFDSTRNYLFVSENTNRRVSIFDVSTITDGMNAINVLGQPNFTSSITATTQNGMNSPYGLAYDSTHNYLFVAESTNRRVTIFNVSTITNGMNAINVLGQPNFTSSASATTQNGMIIAYGVSYDSTQSRLFVAQSGRVTIFNLSSIVDGMNAANVLGQPNFTRSTSSVSQNGFGGASGVTYIGSLNRLFVSETANNRYTIFDVPATVSTTTTVSSSLNPSTYGASVTLTATVSPSAATGNVTFKDGSTTLGTGTLSAGTATLSISSLSVGSHSLTAVYDGTSGYLTSTSDVLSQTVGKATTTVTLGASGNPVTTSATVTLSASVSPADATGQVSFMEGTTLLGIVDLSAGVASLTVGPLSQGIHTFVADYEGSSSYLTSSASLSVEAILPPPAVGGGSGRGAATTARSTTVTRFAAPAEPTAKVTPSLTVPPAALTPRAIARATEKARIQAILQRAAERRAARLAKRR